MYKKYFKEVKLKEGTFEINVPGYVYKSGDIKIFKKWFIDWYKKFYNLDLQENSVKFEFETPQTNSQIQKLFVKKSISNNRVSFQIQRNSWYSIIEGNLIVETTFDKSNTTTRVYYKTITTNYFDSFKKDNITFNFDIN